jgi:hypothetical protein
MKYYVIKGCGSITIFGFFFSITHVISLHKNPIASKMKSYKALYGKKTLKQFFAPVQSNHIHVIFLRSHYMYNMDYQGQTCCVHGVYMHLFLSLLGPNFPTSTHTKFSDSMEQKGL